MQKDLEKKHMPKINRTGLQVIKGSTVGQANDDPMGFRYLPNGATSVGGVHRNSDTLQYKTVDAMPSITPTKEPSLEEEIIEKKLQAHPVVQSMQRKMQEQAEELVEK